jgi:V/A-type H+-transporting ATPase subunit K
MELMIVTLGWFGVFAVMALSAIGSILGCAKAGQTACGAMLDTETGHGKFIGLSAMPSSQSIYGIVLMFILKGKIALFAANPAAAGAIFGIGLLAGLGMMFSAIYQGECCASAINASKSKPEIFGKSVAPAGIVEGFAVFILVFAMILAGQIA